LLALGVACLGGAAAAELWRRVTSLRARPRAAALRVGLPALAAGLIAVSTWPLISGRGVDAQLAWDRIPPAWPHAAPDLDGQLRPLLAQLGAGAAIVGSDDDRDRSGAIAPARAAATLGAQGLARPDRSYGATKRFDPDRDQLVPSVSLPQVRRYDLSGARGI